MSQDRDEERRPRADHKLKIFVGGISFKSTNESLENAFSECGKVLDVFIPTFPDSDKKKRNCFYNIWIRRGCGKSS